MQASELSSCLYDTPPLTRSQSPQSSFSPSCYAVLMSSKKSETAVYGCNPALLKFY